MDGWMDRYRDGLGTQNGRKFSFASIVCLKPYTHNNRILPGRYDAEMILMMI